jgi:putative hydrolase
MLRGQHIAPGSDFWYHSSMPISETFVDIHTHTNLSACGLNTHLEIVEAAQMASLRAVAITDHGPISGGEIRDNFFMRFNGSWKGVTVLRGMEANITPDGTDMPERLIPHCDLVLAGLHIGETGLDVQKNSDDVIRVLETCSYVDVISHPFIRTFPLDFQRVVPAAAAHGVCLELNNATLVLGRGLPSVAELMLTLCRQHGCPVAVGSDAHTVSEVGDITQAAALLEQTGFPAELIVNRTFETTMAWLDGRRPLKQKP